MQDEGCQNEGDSHAGGNHAREDTGGRCQQAARLMRGALLLQEKWVLMIVFSLLDGPLSFCDLMRRGTINTTTLHSAAAPAGRSGTADQNHPFRHAAPHFLHADRRRQALRPILDAIAAWSSRYVADHKFPASHSTN